MRRRLTVLGSVAILAACRAGVPTAPLAEAPRIPAATTPARPAPTADAPRPPAIPPGAPRIRVDAARTLHAASPYVNGYNRNHNHRQFAVHDMDRLATMQALRALAPRWGEAYLAEQRQAGFPAKAEARGLYRTGHGPTDGRTDYAYLPGYQFQAYWELDGAPDTWDGYAYDDFRFALREAEEAGAEPLVTVNFGSDTAASAGRLARWLNLPADPLRAVRPFFALSAAGGPPPDAADAPRGAFLFEIGNEVSLPAVVGHARANSIPEYVSNARPYVEALRAGCPHPVKVALAAAVNVYWGGPARGPDSWAQQGAMARAFVAAARREGITFEALQYHGYPFYPVGEKLAGNAYGEAIITAEILPALAEAGWGPIEIWNDEFHAASALPRNTGMYGALYAADSVVTAFSLSQAGKQVMPVTTDFAAWHAGTANGYDSLYFQDNSAARVTPIYQFRRLLAAAWGDWVLPTEAIGGGQWVDLAATGEATVVTNLHATAARAADGAVRLLVVNRSRSDERAWLEVTGLVPGAASASRIAPDAAVDDPFDAAWNQVVVREDEPLDPAGPVAFPRASITLLTLWPRP